MFHQEWVREQRRRKILVRQVEKRRWEKLAFKKESGISGCVEILFLEIYNVFLTPSVLSLFKMYDFINFNFSNFRHKGFLKDCPNGLLTEKVDI